MIKAIYIILGLLFLSIGAIGVILPMVPTTPFVVLAAVCFAKSSQRLHTWFISTELYRKTIDGFVKNREMTIKAKVILLASITTFMSLSFLTMVVFQVSYFARAILVVVWVAHVIYFGFIVKTIDS